MLYKIKLSRKELMDLDTELYVYYTGMGSYRDIILYVRDYVTYDIKDFNTMDLNKDEFLLICNAITQSYRYTEKTKRYVLQRYEECKNTK